VWRDAWERFIPFLEFPPEVRKIIFTTNAVESLNYQLRKIIKNRGHFPNDDAVIKLLWLAIRDIEDKRARERAKEAGQRGDLRAAVIDAAFDQLATGGLAEFSVAKIARQLGVSTAAPYRHFPGRYGVVAAIATGRGP
jgi:hypothetical protein